MPAYCMTDRETALEDARDEFRPRKRLRCGVCGGSNDAHDYRCPEDVELDDDEAETV